MTKVAIFAVFVVAVAASAGISRVYTQNQLQITNQCIHGKADVIVSGSRFADRRIKLDCGEGRELVIKDVSLVQQLSASDRTSVIKAFARNEQLD